jgi:hypothetical protein
VADNVNLQIGTPAYAGQVHVDYVSAPLVFQRERIPFTLMTIGNESLIENVLVRVSGEVVRVHWCAPTVGQSSLSGDSRIHPIRGRR